MVNAFRQGQITSEDLVDRFGLAGRAKTQAATSAAELGQMQAEAQKPLVGPTAELQGAKTAAELAQTNWGQNSLKTAQETMGWFGDSIDNYKLPNGQTDFQALSKVGAQRIAQLGQLDKWAAGLQKAETREITLGNGRKKLQRINAYGEDVTPPDGVHDGSPRYWYYVDQMSKFMPKAHPYMGIYPTNYVSGLEPYPGEDHARGETGAVPTPGTAPAPASTNPLGEGPNADLAQTPLGKSFVAPEPRQVSDMRANLVTAGRSVAEANAMTPEQVVAASPMQDVVKAAANSNVAPPVITAAAPATTAPPLVSHGLLPYQGGVSLTETPQTVFTADKIREGVMKEQPYLSWQKTIPYATTFETNADDVRKLTPQQQGATNMNMTDLGLAESLIKLYDPEGVIREFKWEKFETNQPRIDLLKNAWDLAVNHRGSFTPSTREKLIQMGEDVIKGREKAARPALEKAYRQAKSNPEVDPSTVFTTEDMRVLQNKETPKASGPATPAPGTVPPGAIVGNIPGIGRGYVANGMFHLLK